MSDRDNPRSLVEIMNDVLSTVREHYDSEYVYYIEKEYEDIDVIYEWCASMCPGRGIRSRCAEGQRPRWMEQEVRTPRRTATVSSGDWMRILWQFLQQ